MIYNDVYVEMNDILRGNESIDVLKKTRAFNEGYRQLAERMAIANKAPGALLTQNKDLATTQAVNFVTLPDDFLTLQSIWKKSGSSYLLVQDTTFETVSLEELMKNNDSQFIDSNAQGDFWNQLAYDDDKIYFDRAFATTGTDTVRIWYYNYPDTVFAYDTIAINTLSADFAVGETVNGGTSNASGTVVSNTSTLLTLKSETVKGTFQNGETITGDESGSTAKIDGTINKKFQTLELGYKYRLALATAGATIFLYMDGAVEVAEKDAVLDKLIASLGEINRGSKVSLRPGVN